MTSLTGFGASTGANLRGNSTPISRGTLKRGGSAGDYIPKGYRKGQLQQFSPEQMELFQQLFGQLGPESFLSKLASGDQETFDEMEAPAFRQFSGLQGNIASRFSGAGGLGNRRSSGFQNTMNSAASNFAQELAARRGDLQRQATNDLWNMSQQLLGQRPQEQFLIQKGQKQPSGWGGLGGAALGGLAGFALGGPGGALTGSQLGYGVGSAF